MKKNIYLHENEIVGVTHFHMNGFAPRHVLIQRQKATWKDILAYSVNVARHYIWHARESRATFLEFLYLSSSKRAHLTCCLIASRVKSFSFS